MNKNLNWKRSIILKSTSFYLKASLFLVTTFFLLSINSDAQSTLKLKNKDANDMYHPYLKIGIGGDYPCGEFFSISLEDEARFIFSSASAFNATLTASGDLDYPNDGIGENGKRVLNLTSYQKSFNRITDLKVGYTDGAYGKKWAIESKQLSSLYPNNVFDITYDGKARTAFDQGNLFYEMLIAIQVLADKNETLTATVDTQQAAMALLTERIDRLESALNIAPQPIPNKTIGNVSINPNPNTDGQLNIEYTLSNDVADAQLVLTDIEGKILHKLQLAETKGNKKLNINLPSGAYLYYLSNNNQQSVAQKLIIQ